MPAVLVVTMGNDLTETQALAAIGYNVGVDPLPDAFLNICLCGVSKAPSCQKLGNWITDVSDSWLSVAPAVIA